MAGAMAGSAILAAGSRKDSLSIVTLTINNTCNLACPHCYLQYAGPEFFALDSVLDAVLDSNCEGISIVGKEPLANKESADRVRELVERAAEKGKWVSLITNGLNAACCGEACLD
jgi:MoaA/NifB/PqqE/SkfB family radical SAM enzyme